MMSSALIICVITVCIIYILHKITTNLKKYASLNKLPGPSVFELLWVVLSNKSPYDFYHYMMNLTKRYGPILKLWIKPFNPIVIVADVEVLNRILLSKDHLCKTITYELIKPLVGDGLGTTNKVDLWKHDRKICSAVFQPSNIAEFLSLIKKHTNKLLERLKDHSEKIVDVQPLLHLYALDLTFEFTTKHEHNFVDNMNVSYLNARVNFFSTLSKRMYSLFLQNNIVFRLSKYFKLRNEAVSIMKRFTHDIIQTEKIRRKDASLQNSRLHLIDVLFANNFHMSSIQSQIDTFITAGHDTIAETLCFIVYALSRHSKVQEKVFQEVKTLVGENGEVTNETIKAMIYLPAVIKETLRLYSVAPVIERQLSSEIEINGIHYPAGTRFVFSLIGVHTSSKYYENPDKFDPDRFMPETAHKLDKHSFVPFSVGPRNCIGQLFAMLVLKYFIARIIQQYEILPDENHTLKILGELVAKSVTGIPVIFKKRQHI